MKTQYWTDKRGAVAFQRYVKGQKTEVVKQAKGYVVALASGGYVTETLFRTLFDMRG